MVAAVAISTAPRNEPVRKVTKYLAKSFQHYSGQLYFKAKSLPIYKATLQKVEFKRARYELRSPDPDLDEGYKLVQELRDDDVIQRRKEHRDRVMEYLLRRQRDKKLTKK